MLALVFMFFVISWSAAAMGFGGLAAGSAEVAKFLFIVFFGLVIGGLLVSTARQER